VTQGCTFAGSSVGLDAHASSYPLQAVPSELTGPIHAASGIAVSVSLTEISQTGGSDTLSELGMLLVAPNGTQLVILMQRYAFRNGPRPVHS
jgi:hypothetical protein